MINCKQEVMWGISEGRFEMLEEIMSRFLYVLAAAMFFVGAYVGRGSDLLQLFLAVMFSGCTYVFGKYLIEKIADRATDSVDKRLDKIDQMDDSAKPKKILYKTLQTYEHAEDYVDEKVQSFIDNVKGKFNKKK